MKITKQPTEVLITFSPKEYCLSSSLKYEYSYALCYLIDRSEKGKDPDVGEEVLYLTEAEAQIFKEAGFMEIN